MEMRRKIRDCHCALCGKIWFGGIDEAIEEGATPDFWIGDKNFCDDPVCDVCSSKFLSYDGGDYAVKSGFEREVFERVDSIERKYRTQEVGARSKRLRLLKLNTA